MPVKSPTKLSEIQEVNFPLTAIVQRPDPSVEYYEAYKNIGRKFTCIKRYDVASDVINAAIELGGKIVVKGGTYNISSPILIQGKSNVVLEGEGWKSTKLVTQGTDTIAIKIGDRSNASLVSSNIVVRGFYIDGTSQTTETGNPDDLDRRFAIEIAAPTETETACVIEECYLYNTGSSAIHINYGSKDIIRNNIFDSVRSGLGAVDVHSNTYNTIITGNIFKNCNTSAVRHGMVITDNMIYNCGKAGYTSGEEAAIFGNNYALIANNYIVQSATGSRVGIKTRDNYNNVIGNVILCANNYAIIVNGGYGHVVSGNVVYEYSYGGILVSLAKGVTVQGNNLNYLSYSGIKLSGSQSCTVTGNVIGCAGRAANNTYDAISLEASGTTNSLYNVISGNRIWSQAANKPRYGIAEADANQDYNIIANNIVTDCATGGILKQGTNSILDNNITG